MKTNKHLIISGIIFTIILFLWPIFMAISQPQGNDEEQFKWILDNLTIYKLQFFFALLLAPSIIYLMLSQLDKYSHNDKIALRIGFLFITGYLVLNSVAYSSQIFFLPAIIEAGFIEQARVWYFNSSTSVIYFIDQLGYCFWGIGAIILFMKFIKERGIIKYLSLIYTISGILSIVAFFGLIVDNILMNSMTLYSGLILIPIGIMTLIWGLKENKKINGT
jgi:hypothetical protein